jgi:Aromatic amino acid lyase
VGEEDGRPVLEYGVTTGFGEFKNVPITPHRLEELQRNILLSHSVGLGETADAGNPTNYFESDVVRATLAIRLTAFLKGHSGIRFEVVRAVQAMLNWGIVPLLPIRGSVRLSGDLCPLSAPATSAPACTSASSESFLSRSFVRRGGHIGPPLRRSLIFSIFRLTADSLQGNSGSTRVSSLMKRGQDDPVGPRGEDNS